MMLMNKVPGKESDNDGKNSYSHLPFVLQFLRSSPEAVNKFTGKFTFF